MAPTSCRGCGDPLPPMRYPGNPRQWCRDACRVRHHRLATAPPCPGCGQPTTGARCAACIQTAAASPAATDRRRALRRAGKRRRRLARAVACRCGVALPRGRRSCAGCKRGAVSRAWQRKNATRRGAAAIGPALSVAQLGARDGWRCHLCHRRVNPRLHYLHPRAGTRDHLVPIRDGGDDSAANLALAHRGCNSRRGARGTVQLLLIGG